MIASAVLNASLWERRNDRVAAWSRGMKQKLALACTLIHTPEIDYSGKGHKPPQTPGSASIKDNILTVVMGDPNNLPSLDELPSKQEVLAKDKAAAPAPFSACASPAKGPPI